MEGDNMDIEALRTRLDDVEAAVADLRAVVETAELQTVQSDPDEVPEGILRRARFVKAFVDAHGELSRDETHAAARAAGYPDMRGIAGWFNGANATLRQNSSTGLNELTGPGYEYWRQIRRVLEN